MTDEDRRELLRKSAIYANEAVRTGDQAMAGFANELRRFALDGVPADQHEPLASSGPPAEGGPAVSARVGGGR